MESSLCKEVFILFGSQTGNAEDIAKDLHVSCEKRSIKSTCANLNSVKKVNLRDVASSIVIVCSTTGNGDAPENCEAWWRSVKLRSMAKDSFLHLPYAVLGLGDTNYDKFCHMGKSIHKRLGELGAKPFLDICCADEATGLEETVEAWKTNVLAALKTILACQEVDLTHQQSDSFQAERETAQQIMEGTTESSNADCGANLLEIVMQFPFACKWLGFDESINNSVPDATSLPNCKKILDSVSSVQLQLYDGHSEGTECSVKFKDLDVRPQDGWSCESPYTATITGARWLTSIGNATEAVSQWGELKRVVHMEVSLDGSGIAYSHGDSVGLLCPNPSAAVEAVLHRLQVVHGDAVLHPASAVVTKQGGQEDICTVEELLSYRLDLVSVPRKASVMALSTFCKDEREERALRWLCSKTPTGKVLWTQFVEGQRLGVADILRLFPSCEPSLGALVAACGKMAPRYYSIATSPLLSKNTVAVAFSVVRYTCGISEACHDTALQALYGDKRHTIRRAGVCTSYLEDKLKAWLQPCDEEPTMQSRSESREVQTVRIFLKPTLSFHLPADSSTPIVLVGPGTGVAPFLGFLQHRAALESARLRSGDEITEGIWRGNFELSDVDLPRESNAVGQFMKSSSLGAALLFFGCRDDSDFLYKEELEGHLRDGSLSSLDVAFSRKSLEKVYVTHKIQAKSEEISRLILTENAHVFICGDGNKMAIDVQAAIKSALIKHGMISESDAESMMSDLKLRRRLVLDIWS